MRTSRARRKMASPPAVATSAPPPQYVDIFPCRRILDMNMRAAALEEATAELLVTVITLARPEEDDEDTSRLLHLLHADIAAPSRSHIHAARAVVATAQRVAEDDVPSPPPSRSRSARASSSRRRPRGFPLTDAPNEHALPRDSMTGVAALLPLLTCGSACVLVAAVRVFFKHLPGSDVALRMGCPPQMELRDRVRVTPLGFVVTPAREEDALPWYVTPAPPPSPLSYAALLLVSLSNVPCNIDVCALHATDAPVAWSDDPARPAVLHGRVGTMIGCVKDRTYTLTLQPGHARLIPTGYAVLPMSCSDGAVIAMAALEVYSASTMTAPSVAASAECVHASVGLLGKSMDALNRSGVEVYWKMPTPCTRVDALRTGDWPRLVGFNDRPYELSTRGLNAACGETPDAPPVRFRTRSSRKASGMVSPFDLPYFAQVLARQQLRHVRSNTPAHEEMLHLLERVHTHGVRVSESQVVLPPDVVACINGSLTLQELEAGKSDRLFTGLKAAFETDYYDVSASSSLKSPAASSSWAVSRVLDRVAPPAPPAPPGASSAPSSAPACIPPDAQSPSAHTVSMLTPSSELSAVGSRAPTPTCAQPTTPHASAPHALEADTSTDSLRLQRTHEMATPAAAVMDTVASPAAGHKRGRDESCGTSSANVQATDTWKQPRMHASVCAPDSVLEASATSCVDVEWSCDAEEEIDLAAICSSMTREQLQRIVVVQGEKLTQTRAALQQSESDRRWLLARLKQVHRDLSGVTPSV